MYLGVKLTDLTLFWLGNFWCATLAEEGAGGIGPPTVKFFEFLFMITHRCNRLKLGRITNWHMIYIIIH